MKCHRANFRGFTLIELMMVSAIIGLLAAIVMPKFANLIRKSKEAVLKGQLGALRSALSIYYADTEGYFPSTNWNSGAPGSSLWLYVLPSTLNGKYIESVPYPTIYPYHKPIFALAPDVDYVGYQTSQINSIWFPPPVYDILAGSLWAYFADPLVRESWGKVFVHCGHPDSSGRRWTSW